jgi:hypothetical protein
MVSCRYSSCAGCLRIGKHSRIFEQNEQIFMSCLLWRQLLWGCRWLALKQRCRQGCGEFNSLAELFSETYGPAEKIVSIAKAVWEKEVGS